MHCLSDKMCTFDHVIWVMYGDNKGNQKRLEPKRWFQSNFSRKKSFSGQQ